MLIIYGCGGHARSVANVAIANGQIPLTFIDPHARPGETSLGFPVLKAAVEKEKGIIGLGDNHRRARLFHSIDPSLLTSLIANNADISQSAEIKLGVFVGQGAYIGPNAVIDVNTIINTHCVIEHDCRIGKHTHISVNSTIAGTCRIGDYVMVGAGATLIDGITIGDNIIIGAGAVVIQDLTEPGTYVGVPARKIKN